MKARLKLTIDIDLLITIKGSAMLNDPRLSKLIEEYLRIIETEKLRRKLRKTNLSEEVRKMKVSPIDPNRDLIKEYYEARASKYGFKNIPRRKRNS